MGSLRYGRSQTRGNQDKYLKSYRRVRGREYIASSSWLLAPSGLNDDIIRDNCPRIHMPVNKTLAMHSLPHTADHCQLVILNLESDVIKLPRAAADEKQNFASSAPAKHVTMGLQVF